jgi:twitching motility protein PilT
MMKCEGLVGGAQLLLEPANICESGTNSSADLAALLEAMNRHNASDLHLVAGRTPTLRANGALFPINGESQILASDIESICMTLGCSTQRLEALWQEKTADFAYEVPGLGRYRVNAAIQRGTVNLTVRRIHSTVPSLEDLGLPPLCKELANKQKGLILVTGPVNSGKSTTMAAIIEYINQTSARRVITIEDPVEYVYSEGRSLITQRELGSDVPTFAEGLRSALRQDPDVILVGELRDMETISACLTAAETGHLVMSTLHTPNAYQAIDRLVDVFPSEQQHLVSSRLASLIEAVLYQMLVPSIDGTREVLAMEIMLATPAIRALIREDKIHQISNTIHTSRNAGMQTMDQALADLFSRELISKEDLFQRCLNVAEVQRHLGLSLSDHAAQRVGRAN